MALTQSSFYKWRCLIALAGVDARLDPEERRFFSKQIEGLKSEGITPEQMKTLSEDLNNPKQPEVFFVRVESPLDQIDLLRMAYFLFTSDDDFELRERQVYAYMKTEISKSLRIDESTLDEIAKIQGKNFSASIKPLVLEYVQKKREELSKNDE